MSAYMSNFMWNYHPKRAKKTGQNTVILTKFVMFEGLPCDNHLCRNCHLSWPPISSNFLFIYLHSAFILALSSPFPSPHFLPWLTVSSFGFNFLTRLWSYDLMALYKSVYYYYYKSSAGWPLHAEFHSLPSVQRVAHEGWKNLKIVRQI